MADPLSIAASAVGIVRFAQELTKSILTIKRFCNDVKYAPDELEEMVGDIGRLNSMIEAIAQQPLLSVDTGPSAIP